MVLSRISGLARESLPHPTMRITITLPPATQVRLRIQAEATGKSVDQLVVESVEARLSLAQLPLRDILAPVHAELHGSGMIDAELDALLQGALEESRSERSPNSGSPA